VTVSALGRREILANREGIEPVWLKVPVFGS